jgi:uncharacterized protein with HEPN domain
VRYDDERLDDIVEAADKIAVRVSLGRERFNADEDVRLALLHLVQIVGEAAAGLSDELISAYPEVPWRLIIATRNRVVHGYFDIDLDVLWDVISLDITRAWLGRCARFESAEASATGDLQATTCPNTPGTRA